MGNYHLACFQNPGKGEVWLDSCQDCLEDFTYSTLYFENDNLPPTGITYPQKVESYQLFSKSNYSPPISEHCRKSDNSIEKYTSTWVDYIYCIKWQFNREIEKYTSTWVSCFSDFTLTSKTCSAGHHHHHQYDHHRYQWQY